MTEENDMSALMGKIKAMMGNNEQQSNSSTSDSNQNFNITPEMINNMANMLKSSSSNQGENYNSETSTSSANNDNNFQENPPNIDFETIMRIKSIMESLNKKDDPRSNLLYSLKPYLRESRKKKLDQYVNLLKITQVTNLFKNGKGDGI